MRFNYVSGSPTPLGLRGKLPSRTYIKALRVKNKKKVPVG